MSNLSIAMDAVAYTRAAIKENKSDNKRYQTIEVLDGLDQGSKEAAYMKTIEKAMKKERLDKLRTAMPPKGASMAKEILPYGRLATEAKIGNCLECSAIACAFLNDEVGLARDNYDAVYLADPGDHIFVVIGQKPSGGTFPTDLSTWKKDAAICDPWANIACLASEYGDRWRAKMDKWAGKNKQVASIGRGWIAPTDDTWYNSIERCEKLSYAKFSRKKPFWQIW